MNLLRGEGYVILLQSRTGYLLVNESEGSLYGILRGKRVAQRSCWGGADGVEGVRQANLCKT
jgi:hypothetical protein